ncbi:DUF6274 family protein [Streptomyces sp. C11-1]|uniref:DUF6274 family protein n=1 Tax=Streptomyces durocortorensis TaxID=2811104 RepID=A0ABY9W559_9ACTN|nr:DUF6274 family protein [Streptomyces durocortorensis]WNF28441.1 DUF6274 family protein [Streptomyces durocortorensis]
MSASTARHETRALLRAHLAAASGYRHLTRHCAVCHRLLRLAMDPGDPGGRSEPTSPSDAPQEAAGQPDDRGDGDRDGGRAERPSAT